jgi:hypothetical protein
MIAEENRASTELVAQLKSMIYNNIIEDFIDYSGNEVKSKINIIIDEQMKSIRYALLSEHANLVILREKYKIYENLKKKL